MYARISSPRPDGRSMNSSSAGFRYCIWIESFTLVANANLQAGTVDAAIYMNYFGLIELVAVPDGVCESFFQRQSHGKYIAHRIGEAFHLLNYHLLQR